MFWLILFAHFLADYPLQSEWVVKNKHRFWVLTLHVATHLAVMVLVVGAARRMIWPYLLALTLMHFWIDSWKNWANVRWPDRLPLLYVLDQMAHYLTIWLTVQWIRAQFGVLAPPVPSNWVILANGYLLATYVWHISERILTLTDPEYRKEVNEQLWLRMAARAGLLSVFLIGWQTAFSLLPAAGLVIPLPYRSGKYRWRALFTDISVSLAIMLFVQLGLSL